MGCDMVVALSRATRTGETFFAHNCNRPGKDNLILLRMAGRIFAPGESVQTGTLLLPQARQTWTVLASRCPGQWGYPHGLNEHGVSIGLTAIRTRQREADAGLTGPDLVRLALERATSARQAVDVVTDLASRHGQGSADVPSDAAFLIVDGREAFVIEMFGPHWAMQHVHAVRAVTDVCQVRQDWDQLSHGLADLAIARGWWPADGNKLDFAGAIAPEDGDNALSLRRWGRATVLLEQHNGQIDLAVLRRVLGDPCEDGTAARLITQCGANDSPPIAWYAFGSPCAPVYFPLFVAAELPWDFGTLKPTSHFRQPTQQTLPPSVLAGLQERFDRETREFVAEAIEMGQRGESDQVPRRAELFMQHALECWENVRLDFTPSPPRGSHIPAESEFHSSGAWS